ncbi:MAG: hypothetical protein JRF45_15405 [Deltaproteobacteria bacterium]|nr:hypothetical protein [Deltaproteobacteria bacterium]MBW1827407.1 hypothetical protein [Deltaproteobacteria bacterium]MBW1969893.1 hypothetical protein [Deltaproteobacteria bacterium]MBW2197261.1 hypothetical protein [Deltaproteobacteria bacterium]MBW2227017.1 hypothetical protein [Deltaproteobacteria bacterium]
MENVTNYQIGTPVQNYGRHPYSRKDAGSDSKKKGSCFWLNSPDAFAALRLS